MDGILKWRNPLKFVHSKFLGLYMATMEERGWTNYYAKAKFVLEMLSAEV